MTLRTSTGSAHRHSVHAYAPRLRLRGGSGLRTERRAVWQGYDCGLRQMRMHGLVHEVHTPACAPAPRLGVTHTTACMQHK